MEDDITFSSQFLRRLGQVNTTAGFGFLTFYLPGDGFGAQPEFDPNRFYGTQCVLFPRESIELLVRERDEMHSHFPPGYDIRWSRFLAAKGYALHATEHSYVQHLSTLSRLHGEGTHVSNRFVP
jgi:hypothetical protein